MGLVVALMGITYPTAAFAEALETKHISYEELNKMVLDKTDVIDTLKDAKEDLEDMYLPYSSKYISFRANGLGMRTSDTSRDGIFYGYAKPILIGKLIIETNISTVEYNLIKAEATVDYQLQKSLVEYDYYNKLAVIFAKRDKVMQTKYEDMKMKYEKGLVSQLQLKTFENTIKQQAITTEKLNWQLKIITTKLAQSAGLENKYNYIFDLPITSGGQFDIADIENYWESAKSCSAALGIENAKWNSILNEEKVFQEYKGYPLESDVLDLQRRKMAQEASMSVAESTLRVQLTDILKQVDYAKDNLKALEESLVAKEMDLKAAEINVKNKSMLEIDLATYQLSLYAAELDVAKSKATLEILNKRADALINLGVYIE